MSDGHATPRFFLSAGESSGDAYGAAILQAIRRSLPAADFTGLGGAAMRAAGQQQAVRAEDVAVMGITEILAHLPRIIGSYRALVRSLRAQPPAAAVLIDFPDVNFRLAKHLRRAGVPVIWFVSPQLWAWKRRRLRWVQQRVDRMLVIFPFEETFYRLRGVEATFVGHPLAELPRPSSTRQEYAERFGLVQERTWIALLPGSRWREIEANLPALHELAMSDLIATAAAQTTFDGYSLRQPSDPAAYARYEFLLPVANTIDRERLQAFIETLNREHLRYMGPAAAGIRLTLVDDAAEALEHARASVVASGTATVLAATIGNPFVVVYRVSTLTYAVASRLVRYPAEFADGYSGLYDADGRLPVAMVNLLAGRRVVPELLQERFTAANVAAALAAVLPEGPARDAQIAGLAEVRRRLQPAAQASAVERVADAVLTAIKAGERLASSSH